MSFDPNILHTICFYLQHLKGLSAPRGMPLAPPVSAPLDRQ